MFTDVNIEIEKTKQLQEKNCDFLGSAVDLGNTRVKVNQNCNQISMVVSNFERQVVTFGKMVSLSSN